MSQPLKSRTYKTVEARVGRVLAVHGRALNCMRSMDAATREKFAALCGEDGAIVAGAREHFRLLMVEHYAEHKATDESLEQPADPVSDVEDPTELETPTELADEPAGDAPTLPAE
jgi:hypothetical protein